MYWGLKLLIIVAALLIPAILILFGLISELNGVTYDFGIGTVRGFHYVAIGVGLYVVESIVYSYLRSTGRLNPSEAS